MSSFLEQSTYWDSVASTKVFSHPIDIQKFSQRIPLDSSILDFGCGQGRLCQKLADAGYRDIVGVDYSAEMIRIARETNPNINFIVADSSTRFESSSFDAVLLYAVLTCIPDNDAQKALIAELFRVLRPGGLLLVSDYLLQDDDRNATRYRDQEPEFGIYGIFRVSDGGIVRHHTQTWLTDLLSEFASIEWKFIDSKTMNGNPARISQIWAQK